MLTPQPKLLARWGQLVSERQPFLEHWRDLTCVLLPTGGRYVLEADGNPQRRFHAIVDNTGTMALYTLASGLMSGMTSPARPWFRLAVKDEALMQEGEVKGWLHDVTERILDVFSRSNTYNALPMLYEELAAFGTAACLLLEDDQDVIRHYPLTAGQYCLAANHRGEVDTLYRQFRMTVAQMVKEFGLARLASQTRALWDNGNLDAHITLYHVIEPRADRDPSKRDALNMPWRSVYFEEGGDPDQPLRESGFKRFPALAPRWRVKGGQVYGESPGMTAFGDVKQLQVMQLNLARAIDGMVNPAMMVPDSLKADVRRLQPGEIIYCRKDEEGSIRPAFQPSIDLNHLKALIEETKGRIHRAFYADMFLMFDHLEQSGMTATEVAERRAEKMTMIGPVLDRLNHELLEPMVEMTFDFLAARGGLPPVPEALQGGDFHIEFVSMLSQAQKSVEVNALDRLMTMIGSLAKIGQPEVLDKLNADAFADLYAERSNVNPAVLRSDEDVAAIRAQRAEQQAQLQQQQAMQQQAEVAAQLGNTPTDGKTALTDLMGQFSQLGG